MLRQRTEVIYSTGGAVGTHGFRRHRVGSDRGTWFVFACLLLVGTLSGCDQPHDLTEPLPTISSEPRTDAPPPDARLAWVDWGDIIAGTGGPDPADCASQELPSEGCCQAFPGLPGCSWGHCNDERDTMISEYVFFQVNWTPACQDFTDSGGSTNFSWSELNGGWSNGNPHPDYWGIITSTLLNNLEATRTSYNRGGITLTSGYRCPHGNDGLPGSAAQSYHMHGRAADMKSASHAWTEEEFMLIKMAADSTSPSPVESFDWDTYADHHYHVAW